jgi:intracellular sulfur oxidation DsrE/DsrF family protein
VICLFVVAAIAFLPKMSGLNQGGKTMKLNLFGKSFAGVIAAVVGLFVISALTPASIQAGEKVHRIAIHVDQNDPRVMNMALNNVANVNKYYKAKGEKVIIEVVAYGPGLHMFRADTSPVKDRIAKMGLEFDNLQFSACGNTKRKMTKKAGKEIQILSEAKVVPSGVVQLIELQEKGYAYVRP